ncbi:MAG TPA: sugar transferase, partial [Gemmataceae bacterium]|nr:sugar transferase [Gemmataceae bacterium]
SGGGGGGDVPAPPPPVSDGGGGAEPPAEKGVAALEAVFVRPMPRWKRAIDVLGSAVGLVLLLPVLAAAAVAVRLSSPGPIFFAQRRSGLGGRPFRMYKFRSMVVDAEARKAALMARNEQDGPAFKIKHDPRVTRVGRFLRATSIDELPQLWNVLKGDMSLVGPRPLPVAEADACDLWQRRRLDVTPGLTCIWQVRGRGKASFADWVRMDLEYIRSQSLPQDLRLLLLTGPAVVLRKGAH